MKSVRRLIIHFSAGEETPYYYSADGVMEAYVRLGNKSVKADAIELKRLVLRGRNSSYDALSTTYNVSDYAFSKLRERYKAWTGESLDNIYSDISREGRVQTRWGNEYRLFMLVNKYVSDTHYQYHCDWLGKQSYDVYLEKYKIAIEYQGQQHYEAVSLFGGEEGLKYNQERDQRKKDCRNNMGLNCWSGNIRFQ